MIRRDVTRAGEPHWLLIPQAEHARLAAEVAACWTTTGPSALPRPELLLPAIRYHDFGWTEWELSPGVDPATGRPRNFTEMPMPEATAIWTRSIAECARQHPVGGVCVSRHFCYLGDLARQARPEPVERAAVDTFLQNQQAAQDEWIAAARSSLTGDDELLQLLATGLRAVQFFDAVSLWLCMGERQQPADFDTPFQTGVRLIPHTPYEIVLEPYPLSVPQLELQVDARCIPAISYPTDMQLLATLRTAPVETLRWRLRRN